MWKLFSASSYTVLDLNADPVLYPVQKSVKEHNSLASYVALVMTKYGHRLVTDQSDRNVQKTINLTFYNNRVNTYCNWIFL